MRPSSLPIIHCGVILNVSLCFTSKAKLEPPNDILGCPGLQVCKEKICTTLTKTHTISIGNVRCHLAEPEQCPESNDKKDLLSLNRVLDNVRVLKAAWQL